MLKTLFALVVVGTLAAAGYAVWYVATPVVVDKLPAGFDIAPGMRLRAAAQRIDAAGVALGRLQFEVLARTLGRAQDVKAGSLLTATGVTTYQPPYPAAASKLTTTRAKRVLSNGRE